MEITVYKGRDNVQQFAVDRVDKDGVVTELNLDEAGVTKVELTAGGTMLSSEDGAITWSGSALNIKEGGIELSPAEYRALLIFYQADAPRGKVTIEGRLIVKRGS